MRINPINLYKKLFTLYLLPLTILMLIAPLSYAEKNIATIKIGEPLPYVEYSGNKNGLLLIDSQKKVSFKNWSTKNIKGKPHIIYHLAAREETQYINKTTIDAIDSLKIPEEDLSFLTLLNGDDVPFGATGIARSHFVKSKKAYPNSTFVFDSQSKAQAAWQLSRKSSALILLDEAGLVLFYKDGKLSTQEKNLLTGLISNLQINSASR